MKNTCKIVSTLLIAILLLAVSVPVFAASSGDTKSSNVVYDLPESFTWSISDSVTPSHSSSVNNSNAIEVAVSDLVLGDYRAVEVKLTASENASGNDFYVVAPNSRTGSYYLCNAVDGQKDPEQKIEIGSTVKLFTEEGSQKIIATWYNEPDTPGHYTDILTFTASIVESN